MSFWCLHFPPKNVRKQVDKSNFCGRNGGLKKSFRIYLTFREDLKTTYLLVKPNFEISLLGHFIYWNFMKYSVHILRRPWSIWHGPSIANYNVLAYHFNYGLRALQMAPGVINLSKRISFTLTDRFYQFDCRLFKV